MNTTGILVDLALSYVQVVGLLAGVLGIATPTSKLFFAIPGSVAIHSQSLIVSFLLFNQS
jgi:hypothetical protein